jgi:carbamoyltransferase
MTLILGINAFHADAAAALVRNGEIIAAAEEERFRRIKHWAGFPQEAIRWCLADGGVSIDQIDHIAINSQPGAHRLRKLLYTATSRPDPRFLLARWRNKRERAGLAQQLASTFPGQEIGAQLHFVEHHRAHLASAFYASPFQEAAVVSVDGFGDFSSGAWGYGNGSSLTIDGQIWFPHSLGAFYTAITQYLGFPNYGDEYKVMGLAPYGQPTRLEEMRRIVRLRPDGTYRLDLRWFQHAGQNLPHQWSHGSPSVGQHWSPALIELLGPARDPQEPLEQGHMDIARSAQAMYEEAFFHLLNALYARHPSPHLCIAGGCGANSVANGKVTAATPFRQVYVQAAAGDAGGALGAALEVWHGLGGGAQPADAPCLPGERGQQGRDRSTAGRAGPLRSPGGRRLCHHPPGGSRALRHGRSRHRRRPGDRLVRRADGVGPPGPRPPFDPGGSPPGRHEGHPEPQDQTAGILPALCPLRVA